jgi:hypothetical protein
MPLAQGLRHGQRRELVGPNMPRRGQQAPSSCGHGRYYWDFNRMCPAISSILLAKDAAGGTKLRPCRSLERG